MRRAFVFGKFMPFHKGHVAMIEFALNQCDFLTVLVCCSTQEEMPCSLRKQWIQQTFKGVKRLEVKSFTYSENELPNTSESSTEVSKVWANTFLEELPEQDLLITSEKYGEYVAEFMGIEHLAFDPPRNLYPISASALRSHLFEHWHMVPQAVKPHLAIKVAILGTESTGKSTLAQKLSNHFGAELVNEAGRTLIENSNSFSVDDLRKVAKAHAESIEAALVGSSPLVILDTSVHTTISYGRHFFSEELSMGDSIMTTNQADLYLYLKNDVAFVQDGTRLPEAERNKLDVSHKAVLKEFGISFHEIGGDWEERGAKAKTLVASLIERKTGYLRKSNA